MLLIVKALPQSTHRSSALVRDLLRPISNAPRGGLAVAALEGSISQKAQPNAKAQRHKRQMAAVYEGWEYPPPDCYSCDHRDSEGHFATRAPPEKGRQDQQK